jgi:hypothetical protein
MENIMLRVTMIVSAGLIFTVGVLAAGAVSAAPAEQPAKPACITAEVNPVTGHVLCIEPLGAAVEPPPPEAALSCKRPEDVRGQWSYSPNCTPEVEGM